MNSHQQSSNECVALLSNLGVRGMNFVPTRLYVVIVFVERMRVEPGARSVVLQYLTEWVLLQTSRGMRSHGAGEAYDYDNRL
jgi:hypothetical protein